MQQKKIVSSKTINNGSNSKINKAEVYLQKCSKFQKSKTTPHSMKGSVKSLKDANITFILSQYCIIVQYCIISRQPTNTC